MITSRGCKENFVVDVKRITPKTKRVLLLRQCHRLQGTSLSLAWRRPLCLEPRERVHILRLTDPAREADVPFKALPCQATGPAPARHALSSRGGRDRPVVSAPFFLRSRRRCAGQVRNAPSRRDRSHFGEQSLDHLWILTACVLSCASGLCRTGIGRPPAAPARATKRPQTDDRGDAVYRRITLPRTFPSRVRMGATPLSALGSAGPPPQSRARLAASGKKTALHPSKTVPWHPDLTARYERLRHQVLIGASTGSGLARVVNHGLKAWMQAESVSHAPRGTCGSATALAGEAQPVQFAAELAVLLAEMVLNHLRGEWR